MPSASFLPALGQSNGHSAEKDVAAMNQSLAAALTLLQAGPDRLLAEDPVQREKLDSSPLGQIL